MKEIKVGDKTCRFDEKKHQYKVDGQVVPGTTSITGVIDKSYALIWWAVNEARDYILDEMEPGKAYDEVEIDELAQGARLAHKRSSGKALAIGTVVHTYAENWIKAQLNGTEEPEMPANDQAQESAIEFLDWVEENDIEFLTSEQMVYHPMFGYAGTYDAKAIVNGDLLVIDFKTSKGIYDEYYLQSVAYMRAEQQRTGEDIDGIAIARFPKSSAGFEVKTVTDNRELRQHWNGFQGALKIHNWQKRGD